MKRAGDGDEEITAISNRENSIGQSTQERTPWSKRSASRTCRALKSVRLARSTPLVSPSTTVLRTISTYNFLISFERLSVPFASSTERTKLFIRRDIVNNDYNYNGYHIYCKPFKRATRRAFQSYSSLVRSFVAEKLGPRSKSAEPQNRLGNLSAIAKILGSKRGKNQHS